MRYVRFLGNWNRYLARHSASRDHGAANLGHAIITEA